jgi:kynureninase
MLAPLVGASPNEVAVMGTLTANLHILMASFYCPNKERYKIIIEGKAFPSDHVWIPSMRLSSGSDFGASSMPWNPKSDIMT